MVPIIVPRNYTVLQTRWLAWVTGLSRDWAWGHISRVDIANLRCVRIRHRTLLCRMFNSAGGVGQITPACSGYCASSSLFTVGLVLVACAGLLELKLLGVGAVAAGGAFEDAGLLVRLSSKKKLQVLSLVGFFVVPQFVLGGTFTHPHGIGGNIFCKLLTKGNLAWLSTTVSVFTLVLIAFERFYVITKPLSARHRFTTNKLRLILPVCWILAVVRRIPQFYYGNVIAETAERLGPRCVYAWPRWVSHLNIVVRLILVGLIPTTTMFVLCTRVIHHLWFRKGIGEGILFQAVRHSRKRVTLMMLTVSVI